MQIEAVRAAERIGLVENAVDDHRQRERQRGEEDAAIAGKERRDDEPRIRAGDAAQRHQQDRIGDPRLRIAIPAA